MTRLDVGIDGDGGMVLDWTIFPMGGFYISDFLHRRVLFFHRQGLFANRHQWQWNVTIRLGFVGLQGS